MRSPSISRPRLGLLLALLPLPSFAGVVEDANEAMTRAFKAEAPSPVLAARNLAILHLAMHDAARACRPDMPTWLPLPAGQTAPKNVETAAREAALTICKALYPAREGDFAVLKPPVAEGQQPDLQSAAAGREVALAWLEFRKDDGSSTTVHYVPKDAPGQWRRTPSALRPPEMPHWGSVKPFSLKSPDQFRPPAPPALDSAKFAEAFNEVKRLGVKESAERTKDQTEFARFWSDFSYTSTPPGHWNEIARDLSRQRKLSVEDSSRLFMLLNVAMADAGIAVWDGKYQYNSWRPVTAIRAADTDGNDLTIQDAAWTPLLQTPPHPEYVSGHSAFSYAAATVFASFFGTDKVSFSVTSDTLPGVVRRFETFTSCAAEISRSRVFGGIHFTYSCDTARDLGNSVSKHLLEECAKKLPAAASTPSRKP